VLGGPSPTADAVSSNNKRIRTLTRNTNFATFPPSTIQTQRMKICMETNNYPNQHTLLREEFRTMSLTLGQNAFVTTLNNKQIEEMGPNGLPVLVLRSDADS